MHNKFSSDETERLRRMLAEDLDAGDTAELYIGTVERLQQWESPPASHESTAQLIRLLKAEMPTTSSPAARWWPLLLMRAQLRVVRKEIWAASALILVLGVLVTATTYNAASNSMVPITLVAPLVAALGIAFLYDSDVEQMLEIENTTLASTRLLLLARLTLVFGFDLLLSLVGSIFLAIFHTDVLLWPLVLSWLAPMAFLSALAFFLSIICRDALVGSVFSFGIWGAHVLLQSIPEPNAITYLLSLPGLSAPEFRPALFGIAVLLIAAALWFSERQRN